MIALLHLLHCW